jgi:thioesterase domain-containing protein/acyl carrier protein
MLNKRPERTDEASRPATLNELGEIRAVLGLAEKPEPPATSVENALLMIYQHHFGISDIGVDDSFFVLGGDSLQAAELMAEIEGEFDVVLPVSVLLESQTPRELAKVVDAAREEESHAGCLVAIRPEGSGPPIFCVHALTGDVGYARRLAATMGEGRPVYGLRALGLQSGEVPLTSVGQIAERYLPEIRSVQPHGPYIIAGSCGGALVAYEMAARLRAAGEPVAGLILLDPIPWPHLSPWLDDSAAKRLVYRARGLVRLSRAQLTARSKASPTGEDRRQFVAQSLKAVIALYQPPPYDGDTLLVHAAEFRGAFVNPARGLPGLVPRLRVAESGTDHWSVMKAAIKQTSDIVAAFIDDIAPLPPGEDARQQQGKAA